MTPVYKRLLRETSLLRWLRYGLAPSRPKRSCGPTKSSRFCRSSCSKRSRSPCRAIWTSAGNGFFSNTMNGKNGWTLSVHSFFLVDSARAHISTSARVKSLVKVFCTLASYFPNNPLVSIHLDHVAVFKYLRCMLGPDDTRLLELTRNNRRVTRHTTLVRYYRSGPAHGGHKVRCGHMRHEYFSLL